MSQIDALLSLLKNEKRFIYSELYDIYPFPASEDYCKKVVEIINSTQHDKRGRRILNNTRGTGTYNKIQEIEPRINVNIKNNGFYIFVDRSGIILYVGKSTLVTDRIFNRVLNHCVQNFDGQQNTMEFWNEYLLKGKTLRIIAFVGISSHSVAVIERLVYTECMRLFGYAPIYNKRVP